jgi:hypothetical protein
MQSPRPRGCVSRYLESGRYRDRDDRQMPTWQNLRLWIVDRAKAEQTDPRLYWASAVKMASRRNSGKIPASKLHPSNYHKTQGKHSKVRFLSSPLKNPVFPRVFRISGQLLWPSVAPMLARCMASCGVAFRVALPKSSRFSSRASRQNTGFLNVPVLP